MVLYLIEGVQTLRLYWKDYHGRVEYTGEDYISHGKAQYVWALISYKGRTLAELEADFRAAKVDYLMMCIKEGIMPEPDYSREAGKF